MQNFLNSVNFAARGTFSGKIAKKLQKNGCAIQISIKMEIFSRLYEYCTNIAIHINYVKYTKEKIFFLVGFHYSQTFSPFFFSTSDYITRKRRQINSSGGEI